MSISQLSADKIRGIKDRGVSNRGIGASERGLGHEVSGDLPLGQFQYQEDGSNKILALNKESAFNLGDEIAKANKYLEYILSTYEWCEEWFRQLPPEVVMAANKIKEKCERIRSVLDEATKVVGAVEELSDWCESLYDFASVTIEFFNKDCNADKFHKALESLTNVIGLAKTWIKIPAGKGSLAAGKFSFVLSYLEAELTLANRALEFGTKAFKSHAKRVDLASYGGEPKPPRYPYDIE